MKRLRNLFESIVYAGMKPAGTPRARRRLLPEAVARSLQRLLDGPAPSDPFYLTNRTLAQKLRLAALIAVPCLLVAAGIGLAVTGYFDSRPANVAPAPAPTPKQIASKVLPNLDPNLRIDVNHDVNIADVHIVPGKVPRVAGTARNNTGHVIRDVQVIFELTDAPGSRVGAASTRIARIEPHATADFSFPVEQQDAAFALVREINQQ